MRRWSALPRSKGVASKMNNQQWNTDSSRSRQMVVEMNQHHMGHLGKPCVA